MTQPLRPSDLELHESLGISRDLLGLARVSRLGDIDARAMLSSRHPGDLSGLVYPYIDPCTQLSVTCRVRRDHPEIEDGKPRDKYLSAYGDRRHLYFPPGAGSMLRDIAASAVIVEAEKSALALAALACRAGKPMLIIACGGCWGWRGRKGKVEGPNGAMVDETGAIPDFDLVDWATRDAVILFDSNATSNEKVQAARRALASELTRRGARVRIASLPAEPNVNGPDDYIRERGDGSLLAIIEAAQPTVVDAGGPRKESQGTAIVRRALEAGVELWHTAGGDAYLTFHVATHREHHALTSRATRDYLTRLHYLAARRAPNAGALQDAIATLGGMARFDGPEAEVHVRLAGVGTDRIYLDLGDSDWRAVEIRPDGWELVSSPPVRFSRPRGLQPLPVPVRGGSVLALRQFVNVESESDFALVVNWCIAAIRPRGPYPMLIFMAEQGAAKTTTARVLRRICDPNKADVRRPPRNTEDLMIAASNGHVVAFDNLSRLSDELSDNLSVLATGGGFSVRQLYTNNEEHIFEAQRPIILNGISQVATRGDLLDRAIVVPLPPILDDRRRDEASFWAEFQAAHPQILGSFLDAVACGLRRLPNVKLTRKPRMADFAMWSVASEAALPWQEGTFLRAYAVNRGGAVDALLDGEPVVDVIRAIAPWEGTATELLSLLNLKVPEELRRQKTWFAQPRQVSDALRRLAPALRAIDFSVSFRKSGHGRSRLIAIAPTAASSPSASSSAERIPSSPVDASAGGHNHSGESPSASEAMQRAGSRNFGIDNGVADAADEADAVQHHFKILPNAAEEDTWRL